MSKVIVCYGKDIIERTRAALELLNPSLPRKNTKIILKPNIVEPMPKDSGSITRPEVIEGIIKFLDPKAYEIYVAEGAAVRDTMKCFKEAGYLYLEKNYALKIHDLHTLPFVKVKGKFWKEFEIAELFREAYIISVPVLKQHPFHVTLSMKNMMGILKPRKAYPTKAYMHEEPDRHQKSRQPHHQERYRTAYRGSWPHGLDPDRVQAAPCHSVFDPMPLRLWGIWRSA